MSDFLTPIVYVLVVVLVLLSFSVLMMHTYERSKCQYRAEALSTGHDFHIVYGCTIGTTR